MLMITTEVSVMYKVFKITGGGAVVKRAIEGFAESRVVRAAKDMTINLESWLYIIALRTCAPLLVSFLSMYHLMLLVSKPGIKRA